jgi:hypothetical protein
MADNVTANSGSGGATFASDDISSIQYPRVKITLGADGVNDGDVSSANPIPVTGTVAVSGTVTVGSHAVTNAGTFIIQENGAALTALQLLDDAVFVDDAGFTHATSKVVVMGGTYQVSPNALDDNDAGAILLDSSHRLVPAPSAAQYVDDADWTAANSSLVVIGGVHDALDTTRTPTSGDVAGISLDPNANARVVLPTLRKLTASFVRPGNTTAYIANGAVANSTTAGSVSLLNFGIPKSAGTITRARMKHSATGDDPQWRVWLFDTTLTPAVGDNATFTAPLTDSLGYIDIDGSTDGTDVEVGWASATIPHTGATVFGLIQTRSAWTPASSETITLDLWSYPG